MSVTKYLNNKVDYLLIFSLQYRSVTWTHQTLIKVIHVETLLNCVHRRFLRYVCELVTFTNHVLPHAPSLNYIYNVDWRLFATVYGHLMLCYNIFDKVMLVESENVGLVAPGLLRSIEVWTDELPVNYLIIYFAKHRRKLVILEWENWISIRGFSSCSNCMP